MRPDGGGGGGATILIDPESLRRAGSRLKGVAGELRRLQSALSSLDVPLLPPQAAGTVPAAISAGSSATSSTAPDLEDVVVELTRRAFWAEYADQMMVGYPLSGAALREFEQYMADGSLLRYATPEEAWAAGDQLARIGASFRKDPSLVLMLAAGLKGGESVADQELRQEFSAGFVNQFGATRMNEIPRAIQALESSQQLTRSEITDPFVLRDMAQLAQEQGIQLHGDPLKTLAPFSVALANATTAGLVTRTVEDEIASNRDTYSTAALLSQGDEFGPDFLVGCFKSGVVDKIAQDSPFHGRSSSGLPEPEYALGWSDGHALPNDTKQIVLEALARNPDAASRALTHPIDVRAANEYGQWSDVHDPMQLLYQYGYFDDHGAAFGHAYAAATDHLSSDHANLGQVHRGSELTANALGLFLHDQGAPAPDRSGFADGLAHDLGQNHIKDIFDSVGRNDEGAPFVHAIVQPAGSAIAPASLSVSRADLVRIVQRLGDQPSALNTFLHDGATYQAAVIDVNTRTAPVDNPAWIKPVVAFDASVFDGTELQRIDDFDAANARHEAVVGLFKDVANSVVGLDNPVADAIVHNGLDAAIDQALPGPDPTHVVFADLGAKTTLENSLRSSLAAGYYKHGLIPGDPPADIVSNGHLIPYAQLPDREARDQFNAWMSTQTVTNLVDPAYDKLGSAFAEQGIDAF